MAKKILDELKWHPSKSLSHVYIVYIHRGANKNRRMVAATNIKLERSFFVIRGEKEVRIPYHRIIEIRRDNKTIWRRRR